MRIAERTRERMHENCRKNEKECMRIAERTRERMYENCRKNERKNA